MEGVGTITKLEIMARQDLDQAFARRNFEVRASNNSTFSSYVVLGSQSGVAFPHQGTWAQSVDAPNTFRYIRIVKTAVEDMNFAEFKVYGD